MPAGEYIYPLSLFFLITFIVREVVAYKHNLFLKYLLTPVLTAVTIFIVLISINFYGVNRYNFFIFSSLLTALIADTLLMIEEKSYLKNGIIFFMMSHILYIAAFSKDVSFKSWNIILIVFIVIINFFFIKLMMKFAGKMFIPVVLYVVMIDAMGYLAITKLNSGTGLYEVSMAVAVLLFWISDFILSINAFVKKIPHSTVYTWLFYGPAQFIFAYSTILMYHN